MSDLFCALCMFTRSDPAPADTVIAGMAICHDHTGYVQDSALSRAITMVKTDEGSRGN